MDPFTLFATSQPSYDTGTAGTVTVPAGCYVRHIRAIGASNATLTITPKGPNTGAANMGAGGAIPLPAAATGWFELDMLGELGPGTTLVFVSTLSYLVFYGRFKSGGP